MDKIYQGDIWVIRLDPTEGSELKKTRPCLVISRTKVNDKLATVTVIPFSSGPTDKSILLINVEASDSNGLEDDSHLVIPQIRTVAKSRLIKRVGKIDSDYTQKIKKSFDLYFGL